MEKKKIKKKIINFISKFVGKNSHIPDDKFDEKQLKAGIKIEYEHTNFRFIAKAIAKDHLMEIPDYYTRLIRMEKEAEKYHKKEMKN